MNVCTTMRRKFEAWKNRREKREGRTITKVVESRSFAFASIISPTPGLLGICTSTARLVTATGWLAGWLVGRPAGRLAGWMAGWLAGWMHPLASTPVGSAALLGNQTARLPSADRSVGRSVVVRAGDDARRIGRWWGKGDDEGESGGGGGGGGRKGRRDADGVGCATGAAENASVERGVSSGVQRGLRR